jgi:hypothetical protein
MGEKIISEKAPLYVELAKLSFHSKLSSKKANKHTADERKHH